VRALERVKELYEKSAGLVLGIAIGMGVVLMFIGAFGDQETPFPRGLWWAALAGEIGRVVLVAGILGAVTRYIVVTEVVLDGLARVLVDRDEVVRRYGDLKELWRNTTQRIYLSGFDSRRDEAFVKRVRDAIGRSFDYDKPYYVADVIRTLDVHREPEDGRVIRIDETARFDLIPFVARTPVDYETYFLPAGEPAEEYGHEFDGFWVDGDAVALKSTDSNGNSREGYQYYPLSGKERYRIETRERYSLDLDQDPFILVRCPYVVASTRLYIDTDDPQLRSVFVEIGVRGAFVDQVADGGLAKQRPATQRQICDDILLPGQGFLVVFTLPATEPAAQN